MERFRVKLQLIEKAISKTCNNSRTMYSNTRTRVSSAAGCLSIPGYGCKSFDTPEQRLSLWNLPQADILDCTISPRSSLHPMGRVVQGSVCLRSYCHPDNGEKKAVRRDSDHYRTQDQNLAYPIETWFLHVGGLHGLLLTKHDDETFARVGTFKFNQRGMQSRN
jgi:hypothetical protein